MLLEWNAPLRYRPRRIRGVLPADRLPDCQVHLPAPSSRHTHDAWRNRIADLPVPTARKRPVSLQRGPGPRGGNLTDALAPREGRERPAKEAVDEPAR